MLYLNGKKFLNLNLIVICLEKMFKHLFSEMIGKMF